MKRAREEEGEEGEEEVGEEGEGEGEGEGEERVHMPPRSFCNRMCNRCMSKASNDSGKTSAH